ncbi:MAG: O-antigen ligase family protein [Microgenomates group bacterium]
MKLHQKIFLLLVLLLPVQLGRHFWPSWSYVMGLRVDYLSPTIYLTDILVFGILLFWLVEKFQINELRITNYELRRHWWVLAFFVFLLLNCFFAQNQGVAIYKFIKIIEFALLGFYVAKNSYVLRVTCYVLPWAVVYSSLIAITQFLKQASLNGVFYWLGERTFNVATPGIAKIDFFGRLLMRPYATFPHPNVLAGFVLVAFILSAPFVYKKNKLLFTFYFLLFTFVLVFSFSRSAWIVGFLVFWFWFFQKKLRLWQKQILLLFFFLLPFLYLIRFSNFPEEAFIQRIKLGEIALQLIKESPLIGFGLNNFVVRLPEFWQGPTFLLQPVHNIYLLIAAETGLIGLLIFLWFLFLTYKRLITDHYSLFTALSAILALGLFDHYWLTLQQTQLLFAIVLGLSWGVKRAKIDL